MDEIGDEFDDKSGNDETEEELPELTSESDELDEFDDIIPEVFSEPDEFDDIIPEVFSEPDEFDDIIPEVFSEPDEFDDIIPEVFSEPDEFDDIIPEVFSEPDEFDDIIPEVFSEPDEFDDDIPEVFSEPGEFDDDIPEVFSEPDEFDDILDDTIHDKEVGERADEDQDSGDVGNVVENENIGPQSTSTVLTSEIEELESNMEHQEQEEEEIEIRPEEYQGDTEPIVNTDESEFIKDVEELVEYAREIKAEDENVEPHAEQENAAYYAEQYYEKLKEKEALNEQDSKEEQETEELRQEVAGELKGDQESGYKSDELEQEDRETSKEITSTEEFEYLWEVRDKLDREGKPLEEIEDVMHEAEEMYETLKNAEKLYEEQELEKLKLVDHEDEATEEDLKEDLDRIDLVEKAVELEERMVQQGESQEEIDAKVEESIETTKFEEKLEKIIEQQELEKLKLVDHEDEEDIDDAREEIDRQAEAEYYMEVEEELHRQGMSQEEIDEQMEEIASNYQNEINKKQEKEEEETNVNEKLEKHDLETNEHNSSAEQCDQIELTSALSNEKKKESDEEENERLQELYRQETGRRPMYARQKSKGYSKWLEQRELGAEKINISKSESEKKKEIDEEGWKRTLKQWIKEASEEERNSEFISELKKALESYNEFEDLTRKYLELYEKAQKEKLSEKEKNRLKSLLGRLHERDPIQFELLLSVFFIKKYITEQYWDDFWNKPLVNRVLSKFFKQISQKILKLKKAQENKENSEEIIRNWIEQASEGEISPKLKVKLKEIVENKENLEALKLELDAIEIKSEDKKDFLKEIIKLGSEESDEEKSERLQELYRQETGRSPIYARKKTKGYSQWLEQRELRSDKIKISKSDSEKKKEIEEEGWKTTLKQWIKEASEEECNAELKSELKKALESYNEFEYLTRKFLELYEKAQKEKLTEIEKNRLKSLTVRLQGLGPIQLELLANIRAFKDYFYNHLWELMNRFFVNRVRGKFFKHISQKYKELRKEQKAKEFWMKEQKKLIYKKREEAQPENLLKQQNSLKNIEVNKNSYKNSYMVQKYKIKFSNEEIEFLKRNGVDIENLGSRWAWLREDLLVPFFLDVLFKKGNKVPTSNDLQNWGYNRFIIILREEYGLTLSDLVELSGKISNINFKKRKSFSIKEKDFLIKNDITPENLTTRWEWVDLRPDLITEFYKDVLYSINNRVPTSRELKKIGYSQLMEKLRKKGISLSDLTKKCGFKPRSRHQRNISPEDLTDEELHFFRDNNIKVNELTSRWSWMDKNPHLVVIFFEEVILSSFGYVPTWDELANTEFYYYIQKLSKLDLSYPEVIKRANHVPNFQFLNNSQKKRIYKTTEFLVNEYLEIGISSKIPSLLSLAKSNDLNVSDVTFGKYAKKYLIKIYGDEYGNQLYSEMWFNKTLGISDDIIKKINDLVDEYSSKFIQSNKIERPIPIKDIVEYVIPEISSHTFTKYAKELLVKNYGKQNGNIIYSEMWPFENLAIKVGSRLHVLINDLLTKFFNKRGIQYISEPYIYPERRPDGVLILTEELKLLLKRNKSLLDQIKVRYEDLDNLKAIVLDFTSDISDLNCTRKTIKYQHSEILLLIIGTSWYSKKPYKLIHGLNQNLSKVCVIDIGFFTKIIDLSSNLKEELQISLDFAQNYNLDSLNRIKTLDKSNLHNTESLRKLLIKEGLIKEKIQEYLGLGLIDHPIKNKLTLEDKLTIKNEKIKNKIAIIDIETTGFNRDLDSIIEIGIVELDIKSGQIKSLFNSQVKDTNLDVSQHIDNTFIKTSGIDIYEISESISIKECEEDLQLIFDNYKCAAYNRAFDFGWLESRGFSIPMKLMDIMRFCQKSFPTCENYKFQEVYRYVIVHLKDEIKKYLTRSHYKSSHRAIDDATCEAELLYYLIKELGFSLSYQSKIFTME